MTKLMTIDSVLVRDFSRLGLLSTFLSLSSRIQTSCTACDCIRITPGVTTLNGPLQGKLYMAALTNEDMDKALVMGLEFNGLTFDDATILYLARRDGTILITGDSFVGRVAASLKITVHDYLWAFVQMVNSGLLSENEALVKYNLLATSVNRYMHWRDPAKALSEASQGYKKTA